MTKILIERSVVEQVMNCLSIIKEPSAVKHVMRLEEILGAALEQHVEQQPVAWMTEDGRVATDELKRSAMASSSKLSFSIPLYTQPQPPRQPLTEDQIFNAIRSFTAVM